MENDFNIEHLFEMFLKELASKDKDIEYCLIQSSVEPIIRFKFGSWLNQYFKNNSDRLTLNLMEANRIDLVVGIDNYIYIIEFGHLLNILKHQANLNNSKVKLDSEKVVSKKNKIIEKIKKIENEAYKTFFTEKKIIYKSISLFSDFKVEEKVNEFQTKLKISSLTSGTLFKYGKTFTKSKTEKYFLEYSNYIKSTFDKDSVYLTGYKEVEVIPKKLSIHYKFDSIETDF